MKLLLKLFANLNIVVGALLLIIPIGLLIILNVAPTSPVLAAFDPEKEDVILKKDIFQNTDISVLSRPKYTFTDPFTEDLVNQVKAKPLVFSVPDNSVSTTGATIQISGIHVNTTIYESKSSDLALSQGVWRDPKYGTPDNNALPIILAAHRWGANDLSWDWRNKNLFTEFDQLKGGEVVTIKWNKVTYKYKISFVEESDHVSRLADLIMYSCVDYYSSDRIIIYADLISAN